MELTELLVVFESSKLWGCSVVGTNVRKGRFRLGDDVQIVQESVGSAVNGARVGRRFYRAVYLC